MGIRREDISSAQRREERADARLHNLVLVEVFGELSVPLRKRTKRVVNEGRVPWVPHLRRIGIPFVAHGRGARIRIVRVEMNKHELETTKLFVHTTSEGH